MIPWRPQHFARSRARGRIFLPCICSFFLTGVASVSADTAIQWQEDERLVKLIASATRIDDLECTVEALRIEAESQARALAGDHQDLPVGHIYRARIRPSMLWFFLEMTSTKINERFGAPRQTLYSFDGETYRTMEANVRSGIIRPPFSESQMYFLGPFSPMGFALSGRLYRLGRLSKSLWEMMDESIVYRSDDGRRYRFDDPLRQPEHPIWMEIAFELDAQHGDLPQLIELSEVNKGGSRRRVWSTQVLRFVEVAPDTWLPVEWVTRQFNKDDQPFDFVVWRIREDSIRLNQGFQASDFRVEFGSDDHYFDARDDSRHGVQKKFFEGKLIPRAEAVAIVRRRMAEEGVDLAPDRPGATFDASKLRDPPSIDEQSEWSWRHLLLACGALGGAALAAAGILALRARLMLVAILATGMSAVGCDMESASEWSTVHAGTGLMVQGPPMRSRSIESSRAVVTEEEFVLRNDGPETIVFDEKVATNCGCTSAHLSVLTLPPGEQTSLRLGISSAQPFDELLASATVRITQPVVGEAQVATLLTPAWDWRVESPRPSVSGYAGEQLVVPIRLSFKESVPDHVWSVVDGVKTELVLRPTDEERVMQTEINVRSNGGAPSLIVPVEVSTAVLKPGSHHLNVVIQILPDARWVPRVVRLEHGAGKATLLLRPGTQLTNLRVADEARSLIRVHAASAAENSHEYQVTIEAIGQAPDHEPVASTAKVIAEVVGLQPKREVLLPVVGF